MTALKACARAFDPACVDGRDAAALFEVVSEGEPVCAAMKALAARRVEETQVWREGGHRSNWDLVPPDNDPDPP